MPHTKETHQNAAPSGTRNRRGERGRKGGRLSTTDETASTTALGLCGPSCTSMHFARYFPFCFLAPSPTKNPRRKKGWRNPQQGMILQGASLRGRLPPPATLAHKEESIEQNANEADSEVRDFRCKLTTCKCQELHARGDQRERRMYMV